MEIRYHLDEHIALAIAVGLRQRGIDVTTTADQGLCGTADLRQLAHALSQGRVPVTCDSDFLVLAAAGTTHAGIVFWPAKHRRLGRVVLDLVMLVRVASAEEMAGRIEFL